MWSAGDVICQCCPFPTCRPWMQRGSIPLRKACCIPKQKKSLLRWGCYQEAGERLGLGVYAFLILVSITQLSLSLHSPPFDSGQLRSKPSSLCSSVPLGCPFWADFRRMKMSRSLPLNPGWEQAGVLRTEGPGRAVGYQLLPSAEYCEAEI